MSVFTQQAVKERLKARVAIDGPTGAGKTWTALQWAAILAGVGVLEVPGKIGVVDTENRSAAYYAPTPGKVIERLKPFDPPYEFFHLPVRPPYDPRELGRIIDAAGDELGEDGVMVIDSLTHYWNGEGGTLDIVDDAKQRYGGNSFNGWAEGTPAQRYMLDKIIHAPFHIIVTMRSKMEYVLDEVVKNGRTVSVPRKVGMAPEQRAGVEYEFTVVADMDLEHRLIISKSRCDEVADVVAPKGRSAEVALAFREWLGTGVTRVDEEQVAALIALFNELPADVRKTCKEAFVEEFGPPAELLTDKLEEARQWIYHATGALPLTDAPPAPALEFPDPATPAPAAAPPAEAEPGAPVPEYPAIGTLEKLAEAMHHNGGCPVVTDPAAVCICNDEPAVPGVEYGDVKGEPATTGRRRAAK